MPIKITKDGALSSHVRVLALRDPSVSTVVWAGIDIEMICHLCRGEEVEMHATRGLPVDLTHSLVRRTR